MDYTIHSINGPVVTARGGRTLAMLESVRVGREALMGEVVGLRGDVVQLMPYGETDGIETGSRVIASGRRLEIPVSKKLLGRVLDCTGRPLDDKGETASRVHYPALAVPPDPLKRRRVLQRIVTGVRAIDGLLSVGRGQRMGIFAGSGVGK